MRTAVIVLNYIVVGILCLALLGITGTDISSAESIQDSLWTLLGVILFAPAVIVTLIYAHMQGKK